MPERWLVISNDATNSGAPRMLLEVLRGVRATLGSSWSCEILLRQEGVLESAFAEFGPVHVLPHRCARGRSFPARAYRKAVDRPWGQPRRLAGWIERWRKEPFDLIYNNTATNGALLPALRTLGRPVLTHVHELEYSLRRLNTPADLTATFAGSNGFLAVSAAAATDLVARGVPAERVTIVPNFLQSLPSELSGAERAELRRSLGLPEGRTIVTGCGHIDEVKGTDLFVELAAHLAKTPGTPAPFFNWIGADTDAAFGRRVRKKVREMGLDSVVGFSGAVADAPRWFAASDVVTITSREESFSMVALEAGAAGRPVVGFAQARGLAEFLHGEPELLVGNLDPRAMAAAVQRLLQDPDAARNAGRSLRARVGAEFLAGSKIHAILDRVEKLKAGFPRSS